MISFLKLDINILNDEKIKIIRKMPEGDSLLVMWIGLLCLAMKSGRPGVVEIGDGIPYTKQMLHVALDVPLTTIELGLKTFQDFAMVEQWEDGSFYLLSFEKHQSLDKIEENRQKTRERVAKHRERKKLEACNVTVTQCNATDKDLDIDKEEEREGKQPHQTEGKNVYLTEAEYARLVEDYGEKTTKAQIEKLGLYMASHGKRYKDHNATIRNWLNNDGVEKRVKAAEIVRPEKPEGGPVDLKKMLRERISGNEQ
jgi:predicted phage replisome organizer